MNTIIQNILVFASLGIAVAFFIKKFFWKKDKSKKKACGSDGTSCGCS
ncbi:FeoB-associated Cys-rich membrane protein [Formosa sp. L2A11]|nr:FeoB-associated Cys-rich membrane protein [Formosa sp. L2A11]